MKNKISDSKSNERLWLLIIWFFFFIINGAIIFFLYWQKWIERDNFIAAIQQWNASYAPYIGAITLFYWRSTRISSLPEINEARVAFYLALICSVIWNGIILFFLLPTLLGTGTIESAIADIREIASMLSWLVAGAIGYYFADSMAKSTPKD
ncbi:hypothetical protein JW964_22645 [candidate division KSB1 bacterium]|nr:hypothetical protein [candidate division KSB1 bacterium]